MSDTANLHVFLRAKAKTPAEPEVDWAARKKEWLSNIEEFYKVVKNWLLPLEEDGIIRYSTKAITLSEDPIGSYDVDMLTIIIGNQEVELCPKGTLIIGAQGRIDIRGQEAVRTILFNDGQWSVVERAARLQLVPFNEDSFQDILDEVMA